MLILAHYLVFAVSHDCLGGFNFGRAEPKNLLRQMLFVQCRSSTGTNPDDAIVVDDNVVSDVVELRLSAGSRSTQRKSCAKILLLSAGCYVHYPTP